VRRALAAYSLAGQLCVTSGCGGNPAARTDVVAFSRAITAEATQDSVRQLARTLKQAWIVEDTPVKWRLLTPSEFGAKNWVAEITFRTDGHIRAVRYSDVNSLGTQYRPDGVPDDQCLDPAGCS
jgi:hypothetical protein